MRDNFYIFDKITFARQLLGEAQSDFNMSMTIDGTKDSCSITVWSFVDYEVEPYTICYHEKTNTWWVVSHDSVDRYEHDSDFMYVHTLELLGAVELLNARDLTDCGFNENRYTIEQFLNRLLRLSSFEFKETTQRQYIAHGLDLSQKVNYLKTFENYTLLSALREFLDGYNCSLRLTFVVDNDNIIRVATFDIIQKTGDYTLPTHDITFFDNVRETKTLDKNSFGTCVVSNAENVTSSIAKTYPSVGSVRISGTEVDITPQTAVIRLPSKVFKANWVKLIHTYTIGITLDLAGGAGLVSRTYTYIPYNDNSFNGLLEEMRDFIIDRSLGDPTFLNAFNQDMATKEKITKSNADKAGSLTFFSGNKLVPYFGPNDTDAGKIEIQKGDNVPYLVKLANDGLGTSRDMILVTKEEKEMLQRKDQGIAYERGSNLITGLDFLGTRNYLKHIKFTDFQQDTNKLYRFDLGSQYIYLDVSPHEIKTKDVSFIVNYYPMNDIKIKVDNQRNKKDIQLYNQNGRLTDSVALSKLVNSYAKEISSDNIVKYMQFTNLNYIPKVGSFVFSGSDAYVINNVSMTFLQNESKYNNQTNYFVDCEFNMSKAISTKSANVNPNTNIRDYGIPQNFNVKRKQVYRDYYELDTIVYEDADYDYYLDPQKIFLFNHTPNEKIDLSCIFKLTYSISVEGQTSWYYQLDTTNYYLNKMFYIMLDFNDNNIIGYGSQNVFSGFVISRILNNLTDTLNTPISYVDVNGEFSNISICYCTKEQKELVYSTYETTQGITPSVSLENYSCFIPQEIYDIAYNDNYSILIEETRYNKDALEIPVFEYACQMGDSDKVLIGDNFFKQYEGNVLYFYSFIRGNNLTQNNAFTTYRVEGVSNGLRIDNGAEINSIFYEDDSFAFDIVLYETQTYNTTTQTWTNAGTGLFETGYDYAIFRHAYNLDTQEEYVDLLFIIKNVVVSHPRSNIPLSPSHYKLK